MIIRSWCVFHVYIRWFTVPQVRSVEYPILQRLTRRIMSIVAIRSCQSGIKKGLIFPSSWLLITKSMWRIHNMYGLHTYTADGLSCIAVHYWRTFCPRPKHGAGRLRLGSFFGGRKLVFLASKLLMWRWLNQPKNRVKMFLFVKIRFVFPDLMLPAVPGGSANVQSCGSKGWRTDRKASLSSGLADPDGVVVMTYGVILDYHVICIYIYICYTVNPY